MVGDKRERKNGEKWVGDKREDDMRERDETRRGGEEVGWGGRSLERSGETFRFGRALLI